MPNTDFLSIKEFACKVGIHPDTVRRGIRKKRIHAFNIGNGTRMIYRIPISEIDRLALFDFEQLINKEIEKRLQKIT